MVGGLVGAMGLGGAIVFNPVLLNLGVIPAVCASTGMYLIMYSQAANTLIYLLMGELNIEFSLWIGGCSCIGILIA